MDARSTMSDSLGRGWGACIPGFLCPLCLPYAKTVLYDCFWNQDIWRLYLALTDWFEASWYLVASMYMRMSHENKYQLHECMAVGLL